MTYIDDSLDDELGIIESTRAMRFSRPVVITLSPGIASPSSRLFKAATITTFVGSTDSPELEHIRSVASAPDSAALASVEADLSRSTRALIQDNAPRLYPVLADIPNFAEVRYARRALHRGMFVGPGMAIAVSQVLYTGGSLDDEAFELVEYYVPGGGQSLSAVIVLAPPELSEVEQEILRQVPPDLSEVNIANVRPEYAHLLVNILGAGQAVAGALVKQAAQKTVDWITENLAENRAAAVEPLAEEAAAQEQAAHEQLEELAVAEQEQAAQERVLANLEQEAQDLAEQEQEDLQEAIVIQIQGSDGINEDENYQQVAQEAAALDAAAAKLAAEEQAVEEQEAQVEALLAAEVQAAQEARRAVEAEYLAPAEDAGEGGGAEVQVPAANRRYSERLLAQAARFRALDPSISARELLKLRIEVMRDNGGD